MRLLVGKNDQLRWPAWDTVSDVALLDLRRT